MDDLPGAAKAFVTVENHTVMSRPAGRFIPAILSMVVLALLSAAPGCSYDLDAFRDRVRRADADSAGGVDGGASDSGAGGGQAGSGGQGGSPEGSGGMDSGPGGEGGGRAGSGGEAGASGADGGPGGEGGSGGEAGASGADGGPGGEGGSGGEAGSTDSGPADAEADGEGGADCASTCTDPCYSCQVEGQLGSCTPVPSGTDPDDHCGSCDVCDGEGFCRPVEADEPDPKNGCADPLDTDACGQNGFCDGAGQCAYKLAVDSICRTDCADGELTTRLCTAEHQCQVSGTEPCPASGGGECNETGDDCLYLCAADSECPPNTHFCCRSGDDALCDTSSQLNNCLLRSNPGDGCVDDRQCVTGHCTDGVCCTSADCPGDCSVCNIPGATMGQCAPYDDSDGAEGNDAPDGTCSPSLCRGCNGSSDDCVNVEEGEDWNDDCAEQLPSTCGLNGACNGNGECALYGAAASCDDGDLCNGDDSCDGSGSCSIHSGDPCAGNDACNNTCNQSGDSYDCFTAAGASCGDSTDDECTDPDSCDGAGNCSGNHEPDTTSCYGADQMIYDGLCNGDGLCVGTNYCETYACWSIPPTGQTTCYDNASAIACDGLPFPCNAGGGPNFCGQDAQYPDNTRSFVESGPTGHDGDGNGIEDHFVTDWINSVAGLVWTGEYFEDVFWSEASANCSLLNTFNAGAGYAGLTGWRAPDYQELASLTTYEIPLPGPASHFPGMPSTPFWSSSPVVNSAILAWSVMFQHGMVRSDSIQAPNALRCVRGAPFFGDSALRFHTTGTGGSEIVKDRATGLLWQKEFVSAKTWQESLAHCEASGYGGHDDWRLPNANELRSLVNEKLDDTFPGSYFPDMPEVSFWSSTTYVNGPGLAWIVSFANLFVGSYEKPFEQTVRCVRGGP